MFDDDETKESNVTEYPVIEMRVVNDVRTDTVCWFLIVGTSIHGLQRKD
jgi:hypothetical protein